MVREPYLSKQDISANMETQAPTAGPCPKGRAVMVLGATSDAGKSMTALALCRIFSNMGYKVCPFKSQNMSLNAKVTAEGHEISMIQDLQCHAARVEPTFRVNPILLKPTADMRSQVVVEGKAVGTYDVPSYYNDFIPNHGFRILRENLDALREEYDIVVMEGAGSPAEINIYEADIANMRAAEVADADCILVVNVEWGGSFAYVLGTIMLMPEQDRRRIKAILYNNVRGNPAGVLEGARMLSERTGIPVLGAVPHIDCHLPQEDSEFFRHTSSIGEGKDVIAVIRTPRIANFTDLDPLYGEDVTVRFVTSPEGLDGCGAIVIPGTKNTVSDMRWMEANGLADAVRSLRGKVPILGICGGYQMMGKMLHDPHGYEDPEAGDTPALGLFDAEASWITEEKITVRDVGTLNLTGEEVTGYELHVGRTVTKEKPLFTVRGEPEGSVREDEMLFGTYLHGVLEKNPFRRLFLSLVGEGVKVTEGDRYDDDVEASIAKVASGFRDAMDMDLLKEIAGVHRCR